MAAKDVPRGDASDFLALGAKFETIEGPNLSRSPDNLGQINKANGNFLQENCSRRKVSGVQKAYKIDGTGVLPRGGASWTIAGASAVPYRVRIDDVKTDGQTEDGYTVYSISFSYFEAVSATTLTAVDITTDPSPA